MGKLYRFYVNVKMSLTTKIRKKFQKIAKVKCYIFKRNQSILWNLKILFILVAKICAN